VVGRHPASARLLDPGAAPAGLPARPPVIVAGLRASTVSRCTSRPPTDRSGGWRPASRRSGTPASPSPPCSTPARSRLIRRSSAQPSGCSPRKSTVRRRLGGAPARARAGRVGVRVRQRQLPRHRRHRRGRARTAPGGGRDRARHRGRGRTGHGLDGRHAVARWRLGCVRRRQCQPAHRQAAVLRLRCGHRPAERRRHPHARRGASARRRHRERRRAAGGHLAARQPGDATVPGSDAGAPTTSTAAERPSGAGRGGRRCRCPLDPAGGALAGEASERGRGWGEDLRSYVDASWHGRGESTASQTAGRCSPCWRPASRLPRSIGECATSSRPSARTWLGRGAVHRHGFPGDFYINYEMYRLLFRSAPSDDM